MRVERCSDERHCQGDKCDKPVEFLLTWPNHDTLYLCSGCRQKYNDESTSPTTPRPAKQHEAPAKQADSPVNTAQVSEPVPTPAPVAETPAPV